MKLQLFQDVNKSWRMRIRSRNGKIIMSGEAYSSYTQCKKMARKVMQYAAQNVLDIDDPKEGERYG